MLLKESIKEHKHKGTLIRVHNSNTDYPAYVYLIQLSPGEKREVFHLFQKEDAISKTFYLRCVSYLLEASKQQEFQRGWCAFFYLIEENCNVTAFSFFSRFHSFLLFMGYPPYAIREVNINKFCKIISEFALEYRTTRERVLQQKQKRADHRERNKTRGKMITDVSGVFGYNMYINLG